MFENQDVPGRLKTKSQISNPGRQDQKVIRICSQIIHLEFEIVLLSYSINVPIRLRKASFIIIGTNLFPFEELKKKGLLLYLKESPCSHVYLF